MSVFALTQGAPTSGSNATDIRPRSNLVTQNCGLTNYPDFSEDPVREGISYLASRGTLTAGARSCNRVSCSYGTGISLCNDSPGSISISGRNVAVEVRDLYAKCDANGLNGRGNAFVDAMQAFYDDGHNVLVKGGFDC